MHIQRVFFHYFLQGFMPVTPPGKLAAGLVAWSHANIAALGQAVDQAQHELATARAVALRLVR